MTSYQSCVDVHGNVVTCTRMYQICTELSNDQAQITVTIKYAQPSKSSDQGQIIDDQNLDPGRKRLHALILGDPLGILCPHKEGGPFMTTPRNRFANRFSQCGTVGC